MIKYAIKAVNWKDEGHHFVGCNSKHEYLPIVFIVLFVMMIFITSALLLHMTTAQTAAQRWTEVLTDGC